MPTYQYACTECGHAFEQFQGFHDDSLTECPACGGRLRKVFNAVGVVFKGSGFYRTDSRADSRAGSSASEPAAATGDKSGTSSGTSSGGGPEKGSGKSSEKVSGTEKSTPKGDSKPAVAASGKSSSKD